MNLSDKAAFMLKYLLEGNPLKMDIEVNGIPMRVACGLKDLDFCVIDVNDNELKSVDMSLKEFLSLVNQMNANDIKTLEINRAMSNMYNYKEDDIKWT